MEEVASTGGFSQGMAFYREENLYLCDPVHATVMKLGTKSSLL
jgi:gluconolactonase